MSAAGGAAVNEVDEVTAPVRELHGRLAHSLDAWDEAAKAGTERVHRRIDHIEALLSEVRADLAASP